MIVVLNPDRTESWIGIFPINNNLALCYFQKLDYIGFGAKNIDVR